MRPISNASMSTPRFWSGLQLILSLSLVLTGTWNLAQAADLEGSVRKGSNDSGVSEAALKGGTASAANDSSRLKGQTRDGQLQGHASKDGGSDLKGLQGSRDGKLSGNAEPDKDGLKGNASDSGLSGQANKPAVILQGSLKDDAVLRPSLKLLPGGAFDASKSSPLSGAARNDLFPLGTGIVQFAGGAQYTPGQPAPILRPLSPGSSPAPRFTGLIPPLSSYTLTPRTSTMWVAPGYEVTPGISTRGTTLVSPNSDSYSPTTQKGVTSWIRGYEVTTTARIGDRAPGGLGGITNWAPGYVDVTSVLKTSITSITPTGITRSGVTNYTPGYQVNVSTSRSGVVCWTPGYEVTVQVPGMTKSTLGGIWSAGKMPPELIAAQGTLKMREFAQIVPLPTPLALVATPLLLPQLQATAADANLTWDEWYKRVATAIYDRWKHADVGPGLARVRVNVTAGRDLSCQLLDFYPAADMDRNVTAETAFRETAVRVVNSVNRFEIPELPPLSPDKKVVSFDVDLKRTVDGPAGIDVASARAKAPASR